MTDKHQNLVCGGGLYQMWKLVFISKDEESTHEHSFYGTFHDLKLYADNRLESLKEDDIMEFCSWFALTEEIAGNIKTVNGFLKLRKKDGSRF